MNIGKKIRIKRIVNRKSGKTVIIPMDHGVSMGPIQGLEDIDKTVNMILRGGANATVVHKGIVTSTNRSEDTDIGLIIHLSASNFAEPLSGTTRYRCVTLTRPLRWVPRFRCM